METWKRGLSVLLAVLLTALIGAGSYRAGKNSQPPRSSQKADQHPLLARTVFSSSPKDPLINFTGLREDLQKYFQENNLSGSLLFEYLPTGTQVRVQGDDKQQAASLLKVPLAMEVYKAIEMGKITLDTPVTLRADWLDAGFGNLYKKGAGYILTVNELIKIMLIDSDNTALKALADTMDQIVPVKEGVFSFIDAEITQNPDLSVSIGARAYGSILKCLYFACYISPDDSENILRYLTETKFDNRLMAGIDDKSIKVAHKIGVFQNADQSDCGIVYYPNRPYLICVMLEGPNTPETEKYIAVISKKTYDYIKEQ